MSKKIFYEILITCLLVGIGVVLLLSKEQLIKKGSTIPIAEKMTIDGEFIEDLGHPFSGPAILSNGNYFRISSEKAREILTLRNGTKVRIVGSISEQKRTIPESGKFRMITEKVFSVESFELLNTIQQK